MFTFETEYQSADRKATTGRLTIRNAQGEYVGQVYDIKAGALKLVPAMVDTLRGLKTWAEQMGGWDAPVWQNVDSIVGQVEEGEPDAPACFLYDVRAGDEINDMSLFVVAADPGQAAELWREYFTGGDDEHPTTCTPLMQAAGPARALDWEALNGQRITYTGPDEYLVG